MGSRGHAPPEAQRGAHGPAGRLGGGRRHRRAHAQGGGQRRHPRLGGQRGGHPLRDRLGRRARRPTRRWCATCSARSATRSASRSRPPRGACPTGVIACVGGGSNAIGAFVPVRGRPRRGAGGRRGRRGRAGQRPPLRAADHRRARRAARRAGRRACRTRTARSWRPTRSRPGWTTPAPGPEHAWLRDEGRVTYDGGARRGRRGRLPRAGPPGGDHPRAGALARAGLADGQPRRASWTCWCSPAAATRTWPRSWRSERRLSRHRAPGRGLRRRGRARGADALPDGRPSRHGAVEGVLRRRGGRRCRPDRAGRALLRPAGRRPRDPRRGHPGAGRGRDPVRRAATSAPTRRGACRWC